MLNITIPILIGKITSRICNLIPGSKGTSLPGLIALRLNPNLIKNLVSKNHLKSVIITGTNGKTTTAKYLAHILKQAQIPFFQNQSGSNLQRGIASTIISQSSLAGKLHSRLAIFEVDEAVVPSLTKILKPQIILFTNLFRDQLDRYGEIDSILTKWQQSLKSLNSRSTLIYNCDDPSLEFLARDFPNKISYGLTKGQLKTKTLASFADATFCQQCHSQLTFTHIFTSHLGHYFCSSCSFKRSSPNSSLTPSNSKTIYLDYNRLAATTIAQALNISRQTIHNGLKKFTPAFGRGEKFLLNQLSTQINLVKNPTGFNLILESLSQKKDFTTAPLLLILNDNLADGRDVSWIWDVNFNYLKRHQASIIVSGTRAHDLILRLKYANLTLSKIIIKKSIKTALKTLSDQPGKSAYILPTYTAMLQLRKIAKL